MYCIVHRATYRICTRTRTVDSSNQASPAHASALSKRFLNSLASLANALLRYVVLGRHSSSSFRAYFLCSARHSLRSLPLYFRCSDPRWGWGGVGGGRPDRVGQSNGVAAERACNGKKRAKRIESKAGKVIEERRPLGATMRTRSRGERKRANSLGISPIFPGLFSP